MCCEAHENYIAVRKLCFFSTFMWRGCCYFYRLQENGRYLFRAARRARNCWTRLFFPLLFDEFDDNLPVRRENREVDSDVVLVRAPSRNIFSSVPFWERTLCCHWAASPAKNPSLLVAFGRIGFWASGTRVAGENNSSSSLKDPDGFESVLAGAGLVFRRKLWLAAEAPFLAERSYNFV